jgi:hypothetical protein
MDIEHSKLRELGYKLLGPTVAPFVTEIAKKLNESRRPTLFLMREGFHFHRLFDAQFEREGFHEGRSRLKKVNVSRAFLFSLCLDKVEFVKLALTHQYEGTFENLLQQRFLITGDRFEKIRASCPKLTVSLPRDNSLLPVLIVELTAPLHEAVRIKRDIYGKYLTSLLSGYSEFNCVDIGFSGTIQILISRLFNLKSHGYYMYLSKKFKEYSSEACSYSAEGHWISDSTHGNGNPLVDFSLVAEGIFTSPEGQLRDIKLQHERIVFQYAKHTKVQDYFFYTYPIIEGIDDMIRAMHEQNIESKEIHNTLDVSKTYELILRHDFSHEMIFLRNFLEVDDSISGLGILKPFNFLPGLK